MPCVALICAGSSKALRFADMCLYMMILLIPLVIMLLVGGAAFLVVKHTSSPIIPTPTPSPMPMLAHPVSQAWMVSHHASIIDHGSVDNSPDSDAKPWLDPSATVGAMGIDTEPKNVAMEVSHGASDGVTPDEHEVHHKLVTDMSAAPVDQAQDDLAAPGVADQTDSLSADSGGASITRLLSGPGIANDAVSTGTAAGLVSTKQNHALVSALEADTLQVTTSSMSTEVVATAVDFALDNPKPRLYTSPKPSADGSITTPDASSTADAASFDAAPENFGVPELSTHQLASSVTAVVAPEAKGLLVEGRPVDTALTSSDAAGSNTGGASLASMLATDKDTALSAVITTSTMQISAHAAFPFDPASSHLPSAAEDQMLQPKDHDSAFPPSTDLLLNEPSSDLAFQDSVHQQCAIEAQSQSEDVAVYCNDPGLHAIQSLHAAASETFNPTDANHRSTAKVNAVTADHLQDAVDTAINIAEGSDAQPHASSPLDAALYAEPMEPDEDAGPTSKHGLHFALDHYHAAHSVTAADMTVPPAKDPAAESASFIPQPLPEVAEVQRGEYTKEQLITTTAETADMVAAAAASTLDTPSELVNSEHWPAEHSEHFEDDNAALAAEMAAIVAHAESSAAEASHPADSGL